MFIKKFFNDLFKSFINIYDDKGVRESYGEDYADNLAGTDPITGRRKISVTKIISRIIIIALALLIIFILIRINTDTGYWLNKNK